MLTQQLFRALVVEIGVMRIQLGYRRRHRTVEIDMHAMELAASQELADVKDQVLSAPTANAGMMTLPPDACASRRIDNSSSSVWSRGR